MVREKVFKGRQAIALANAHGLLSEHDAVREAYAQFTVRYDDELQEERLGQRMKRLRGTRSQADCARIAGMSQQQWAALETGAYFSSSKLSTLRRIALALDTDVGDLLRGVHDDLYEGGSR